MGNAFHTTKVAKERDEFFGELYSCLPKLNEITGNGQFNAKARRFHKIFLPIYVMKRYCPTGLQSQYSHAIFTYAIECEAIFALGMRNAAMATLRTYLESAFKLLYYEYHPVENIVHHLVGGRSLRGSEFREFLYSFPGLSDISMFKRECVESLWTELCKFAHGDVHSIEKYGIVADIKSAFTFNEADFATTILVVQRVHKLIIAILFAAKSDWAAQMEKALFDTVFQDFTAAEQGEIKSHLRVE